MRTVFGARVLQAALGVTSAGILVILCVSVFVPVYGDEVATRIMRGMFFVNGWQFNSMLPQCSPDYLRPVPVSLLPAAMLYNFIYAASTPLGLRLTGLAIELGWLSATLLTIRSVFHTSQRWRTAVIWLACIVGLGVLPLTLSMARGEQMLLLILTVVIGFPSLLASRTELQRDGALIACAIVFCIVTSLFFYTHPKALFFFPVLLVSAWQCFWARRKLLCAVVCVLVLVCVWQSLQFILALTTCPNAPEYRAIMSSIMMPMDLLFKSPGLFVDTAMANIQVAPVAIANQAIFAAKYEAAWIAPSPNVMTLRWTAWVNQAIAYTIAFAYWSAVMLPPILFLLRMGQRRIRADAWWAITLWVGLLGHVVIYKAWSFYAGGFVMPLVAWLVVLCIIALLQLLPGWIRALMASAVTLSLSVIFLASASLLVTELLPTLSRAAYPSGIGMPGQMTSIPTLDYAPHRSRIREFAQQCHLRGDQARRLVVDNLTYFAFDGLRQPLHSDYLSDQGFGTDLKGDAELKLFKQIGVKGLIAQCRLLSAPLLPLVKRDGDLCCLVLD